MNKKVLIGIISVLVLIVILFALGRPNPPAGGSPENSGGSETSAAASSSSTLDFAGTALYDFGIISMAKGPVSYIFNVTNPTAEAITAERLQTSCMCTNAYVLDGEKKMGPFGMPGMGGMNQLNLVIKPGETKQIQVVFDPAAHGPAGVGAIDRMIELMSARSGVTHMEIKAVVTP